MKETVRRALCGATISIALAGCGGGGGDAGDPVEPGAASAEGAYQGSTSAGQHFQTLVLEDGQIWALYGVQSGSVFLVDGFVQGAGSARNGTYTTSNGKDFGFAPALPGTLTATYVPAVSISGSVSSSAGSRTFTGTAIPPSEYNYNTPAKVSDIAGGWNLTDLDGESTSLSIAGNGAVTGFTAGCSFSGTVTPRASGKNVFNVTVVFGGAPCLLPGQTAQGIAVSHMINGGSVRQLIVVGTNQARTVGTALFGTR